MFEFMTVRELYEMVMSGSHVELDTMEYVQLQGWIRTNRSSGKMTVRISAMCSWFMYMN